MKKLLFITIIPLLLIPNLSFGYLSPSEHLELVNKVILDVGRVDEISNKRDYDSKEIYEMNTRCFEIIRYVGYISYDTLGLILYDIDETAGYYKYKLALIKKSLTGTEVEVSPIVFYDKCPNGYKFIPFNIPYTEQLNLQIENLNSLKKQK